MKLEFSQQIIEKYSNIKFHKNPFIGTQVVPCEKRTDGQTDMTNLTVTFRNFANVPNDETVRLLRRKGGVTVKFHAFRH
jgi:hypothetical protein